MKRIIVLIAIISLFLTLGIRDAFCDVDGAIKKLGRGGANLLTCPLELVKCVGDANYSDGPAAALTYGFAKGVYRTLLRAGVGIFELATFPFPFPKDYEPILTDPEFFLQDGLF